MTWSSSPYSGAKFVSWSYASWTWVFLVALVIFNGVLAILYALDFLEVGFRAPMVPLIWSGAQLICFALVWVFVVLNFFWEQLSQDRSSSVAIATAGAVTNLLAFILFLIWVINNNTTSKISFDDNPRAFSQYADANVAGFVMYVVLLGVALMAAAQRLLWEKTLVALDIVSRSPGSQTLSVVFAAAAKQQRPRRRTSSSFQSVDQEEGVGL